MIAGPNDAFSNMASSCLRTFAMRLANSLGNQDTPSRFFRLVAGSQKATFWR